MPKPSFVLAPWLERIKVYQKEIEKILDQKKNILFLVPEISFLKRNYEFLKNAFLGKIEIILLRSGLKRSEYLKNWEKIFYKQYSLDGLHQGMQSKTQSTPSNLVLGTRLAVFAPFENLGLIILDQEENINYKQYDRSPFYHTREVALKLADLFKTKIILGSQTPSLESYKKIKEKKYQLIQISPKATNIQTTIVDLNQERLKGNFSIFSEILLEKIKKKLREKKKILLFVNRKGLANFIFCQNCGWIEKCPNCNISLTAHFEKNTNTASSYLSNVAASAKSYLACHHCNYSKAIPLICPICQGSELKSSGFGSQRVEREIKKIFPKNRILRIDQDSFEFDNKKETAVQIEKAEIIIATQMIFGQPLPSFGLSALIQIDQSLNLPYFKSLERTFQISWKLKNRSEDFLVQSYNPEIFLIQALIKNDLDFFYQRELEQRKKTAYPPFGKLIKLFYRDKNSENVKRQGEKELGHLKKILKEFKNQLLIFGPSLFPKEHNKYKIQLVLKLPLNDSLVKQVSQILLENLPLEWRIDVDPESLI